jgi:hypothetical protein
MKTFNQFIDEANKCWPGYKKKGTQKLFGKPYNRCVKAEYEPIEGIIAEDWSNSYKRSIDCSNPKGFSQKAHCSARKKRKRGEPTLSKSPFNEMMNFKPHKTVEQIAKKHRLDVSFIEKQLEMGVPIEHEHTKDKTLATDIALQHLDEIPDYYTRLKKMEASAKKEHSKFKDAEVSEGTLHHWFKGSKSKGGKPGWVQADGSPCANEPGETGTPKCFSSGRLAALKKKGKKGKQLIASAVRRKRLHDKNQQLKTGGASPTYVSTFKKGKSDPNYVKAEPKLKEGIEIFEATRDKPGRGSGTKDECYHKVRSRYRVWPSAYACVPENGTRALTRDGWKTVDELSLGEEIMTYSLHKDELEFKPILNLHRYKNANTIVVKSGNTGFIFEATNNHNWVVKNINSKTDR